MVTYPMFRARLIYRSRNGKTPLKGETSVKEVFKRQEGTRPLSPKLHAVLSGAEKGRGEEKCADFGRKFLVEKSCAPRTWLPQRRGEGVHEGYPRAPPSWSTAGRVSAPPHLRTSRASNCPVMGYGPSMHFFRTADIG